jgi:acetyltransferase-like isoleucine patch superfamily enzyme
MASNVLITDSDHVVEIGGLPVTKYGKLKTAPVRIGDNCWIGQNVVIVKGVTIGDNCVIGANSVVTSSVEAGSIVVGSPARVVGRVAVNTLSS